MVQVITRVQRSGHHPLHQCGHHTAAHHSGHTRGHKRVGGGIHRGRKVGTHHVQATVGQVDKVHDAKHQRQAGRQHEQQHPKLQAVEQLDEKQRQRHAFRP